MEETQTVTTEAPKAKTFVEQAKEARSKKTLGQEATITHTGTEVFNLPVGEPSAVKDTEALKGEEVETEETEQTPSKIKIQGKEFNSVEDALEYARALVAKEQAREELKTEQSDEKEDKREPLQKFFDEVSDEFWTDPSAALAKIYKLSVETAKTQIVQEQSQKQEETSVWNNFYESNPELSEFQDVVKYVMQKDWMELKDMKTEEGMKEIAVRTRKLLKLKKQAERTETELPRTSTQTLSSSSGSTQAPPAEKKLADFVSQLKKWNKRGVK